MSMLLRRARSFIRSKWSLLFIFMAALAGYVGFDHLLTSKPKDERRWVEVSKPTDNKVIIFNGTFEGSNTALVRAPFESLIRHSHVAVGDQVKAGDKLVELDVSAMQLQLLEAKEALIKSEIADRDASNWREAPSFRAIQRQKRADEDALKLSEQKLNESQRLYQAGIISREELSQGQQSVQSARSQLQGTIDNLEATEKKATSESMQLAQLELQKQKIRLGQLQGKVSLAQLQSPITGVVTQMGVRSGDAPGDTPSQKFSEGAVLAKIVDTRDLIVVGTVSEEVIDRLKVGMRARVRLGTATRQVMEGSVEKVSALPITNTTKSEGPQEGRGTKFSVHVKLSTMLSNESTQRILGTSAEVSVPIPRGQVDDLLVIPLTSVHSHNGKPSIIVRSSQVPNEPAVKPVVVIDTLIDGIVVTAEGVAEGDQVLVNPNTLTGDQLRPFSGFFSK